MRGKMSLNGEGKVFERPVRWRIVFSLWKGSGRKKGGLVYLTQFPSCLVDADPPSFFFFSPSFDRKSHLPSSALLSSWILYRFQDFFLTGRNQLKSKRRTDKLALLGPGIEQNKKSTSSLFLSLQTIPRIRRSTFFPGLSSEVTWKRRTTNGLLVFRLVLPHKSDSTIEGKLKKECVWEKNPNPIFLLRQKFCANCRDPERCPSS